MNANMQQKMFPFQVLCVISVIVFSACYNFYAAVIVLALFKAMISKNQKCLKAERSTPFNNGLNNQKL